MLPAAPAMTRTLLIVDDNESVRESLRFLLQHRGYMTAVAGSGAEAIALVGQQAFDGVIVDMNMPGMNGVAVCRSLQAHAAETGRKLATWVMTGARTSEVTKAAAEAGALGVLTKPFDFDELFRRFEEQFGAPPPKDTKTTA
jgi:CheY-like chemotaxis protein